MRRATVTQLVDFAKCEKFGILKLSRAETLNAQRQALVDHGANEHARMERAASVDGRCFVASFAFGVDAPQTQRLRTFRDEKLLCSSVGRCMIRIYYALSPWAVIVLRRHVWGLDIARALVSWAVRRLDRMEARDANQP